MKTNTKKTAHAGPRPDPAWKEWAKTADPARLLREHFGRRALCLGNWSLPDELFCDLAFLDNGDPDGPALLRAFDLAGMEGARVESADASNPNFAPTIRAALLDALRATPRPDAPAIVVAHTADLPDADPAGELLRALRDFSDARLLLEVPPPTPEEKVALGVRLPLRDEGRLRRLLPFLLGVARLDFAATFRRVEPLWRYPFPTSPALAFLRVRLRWLSPAQGRARGA